MSLAEQYEREKNTSRQKAAQHRKMYEAYRMKPIADEQASGGEEVTCSWASCVIAKI